MSRHKNIRGMNLDDELGDYDGDDYYEEEEEEVEMSASDKAKLESGLQEVRQVIGHDVPSISDLKIRETLWYYYFDVSETITYLLNQVGAPEKAEKKKKPKAAATETKGVGPSPVGVCGGASCNQGGAKESTRRLMVSPLTITPNSIIQQSLDLAKFWADTPFGGIPEHRVAELLPPVRPCYPVKMSGLLGGSGLQSTGKTSKLAALAKARSKAKAENAANSNAAGASEPKSAAALLDRLSKKKPVVKAAPETALVEEQPVASPPPVPIAEPPRPQTPPSVEAPLVTPPDVPDSIFANSEAPVAASPSFFANSLIGRRIDEMLIKLHEGMADAQMLYFSIAPSQKAAAKAKKGFEGPSPDDVVIAAQSQSKGITKGQKASGSGSSSLIQKGVENIKLADEKAAAPKIVRKKIDVLAEYESSKDKQKENANLVVIGHVDAGKSTLMGRLLYDSGVVDERTIQKYKQEAERIGKSSFALAWVLDQTGEERARGVTIDIAVNAFETPKGRFTILDAPGHRDFIPNMIAGAAQADFAVLVIDSSPGEFEAGFNIRGQTKEHALLVRSMGIQRIIVAVNKLDLLNWDEGRFTDIKQQMTQFLGVAGFHAKNISFVPCSGLTGDNIVRKPAAGALSWYDGPTLVEELETAKPVAKAMEKPLRMTIGDVYRGGVTNPVTVSGRIEIGHLQVGDTIHIAPGGEQATIKGVEVDNSTVEWAVAGNNVQLHLAGIEMQYIRIGDVICHADHPLIPLREFTAKIIAFESLTPMMLDIHRGRLNAAGRISKLVALLEKGDGSAKKQKPKVINPGALAVIEVSVTGEPLPLEKGSKVVLRADGLTVAAGVIE